MHKPFVPPNNQPPWYDTQQRMPDTAYQQPMQQQRVVQPPVYPPGQQFRPPPQQQPMQPQSGMHQQYQQQPMYQQQQPMYQQQQPMYQQQPVYQQQQPLYQQQQLGAQQQVHTPPEFGTQVLSNEHPSVPAGGLPREKRKRSITSRTAYQSVPLENPVVIPATEPLSIITDIGITAYVNPLLNNEVTYTGESKMTNGTTKEVTTTPEKELSTPVADSNILGDSMYAYMKDCLNKDDCWVVYQNILAEYCFSNQYVIVLPSLKEASDASNITIVIKELATAIESSNLSATYLDKRLTVLVNGCLTVLTKGAISIDSVTEDYRDASAIIAAEYDDVVCSRFNAVISTVTSIITNTVFKKDAEAIGGMELLHVNELYVVLDKENTDNVVNSFNNSSVSSLTSKSAPALYAELSVIMDTVTTGFTFLLTDECKYMLVALSDSDNTIVIIKV